MLDVSLRQDQPTEILQTTMSVSLMRIDMPVRQEEVLCRSFRLSENFVAKLLPTNTGLAYLAKSLLRK